MNVFPVTPMMAAAGVGIYKVGESPGTSEDAIEAVKLAWELAGGQYDVNTADENGDTAMHGAAFRGANGVVEWLYSRDAKVDLKNKKGQRPVDIADGIFHISVFISNPETAQLLRKLMSESESAARQPPR